MREFKKEEVDSANHHFLELIDRELVRTAINRVQLVEDLLAISVCCSEFDSSRYGAAKRVRGEQSCVSSGRCGSSSPASLSAVAARTARG
jgi:hypothetical protein